MGLFHKKKQKQISNDSIKLPKLPDIPTIDKKINSFNKLPNLSTNKFNEKFSQDKIKHAISGEKEVNGNFEKGLIKKRSEEIPSQSFPEHIFSKEEFSDMKEKSKESPDQKEEPIFIRIDKFKESIKKFEDTKKELLEIEELLSQIKKTKEKETIELEEWEEKIKKTKEQIEIINKNIFSKVD